MVKGILNTPLSKPKFVAICQGIDMVNFSKEFLLNLKTKNFDTVVMPKIKKSELNDTFKELVLYSHEIKLELSFGIKYDVEEEPVKRCFSKLFKSKFVPKTADQYYLPLVEDLVTDYFVTSFYHNDMEKLKYYVGSAIIVRNHETKGHLSTNNIRFYDESSFVNKSCSPHNIWAFQHKIFVNILFDSTFKFPSINNLFNNGKGFTVYNIDYDFAGVVKEYIILGNFNHLFSMGDFTYTTYKVNNSLHEAPGKKSQVYLTEFDDERKFVNQLKTDEKIVTKNKVISGSFIAPAETITIFMRE